MNETTYITINENKIKFLLEHIWTEEETPQVATSIDYEIDGIISKGFFLATYGAIYIFKQKFFGSPEIFKEIHILDCQELVIQEELLTLRFNEFCLKLFGKEINIIAEILIRIYNECTYDVKLDHQISINNALNIQIDSITERPKDILKKRSIFLAHYYKTKGDQLSAVEYFDKFEEKTSSSLILGPHFHPGNFAAAFGHAIAWENAINTVIFLSFAPSKFPFLLESMLRNTKSITRIAFTDYKEKRLPTFETFRIESTSVNKFWFMRDCGRLISQFFDHSDGFLIPMEELVIASCTLRPQEFGDIISSISSSPSACELRRVFLVRIIMKPFPFDEITRLLSFSHRLEVLTIRGIDIDATLVFRTVFASNAKLRSFQLTHMQFRTDVPKTTTLPGTILMINVSCCAFSSTSFKSLIECLTSKHSHIPFFFQAQSLVMKSIAYSALQELDFAHCHPNMSEIDWSGNHIPKEPMRYFFAFLFTQKRNHLLMLNDIRTSDSQLFLQYLTQLIYSVTLSGLDISGKFPSNLFIQFIQSLSKATFLRRLKIKCKNISDLGISTLIDIIPNLPLLTEVIADGFKPKTQKLFFDLWTMILQHQSIQTCDIPNEDLSSLGLSLLRLPPDMQTVFGILLKKPRPSTISQRLEYLIEQYRNGEQYSQDGMTVTNWETEIGNGEDIFHATSTMIWNDDSDGEQIDDFDGGHTNIPDTIDDD